MQELFTHFKSFGKGVLAMACLLSLQVIPTSFAADHKDGPRVSGDPAADITDVYVFNESQYSQNMNDDNRLCFVLNSNGLIPPGQARSFGTDLAYEIKIGRGKQNTNADMTLTFRFGAPDASGSQKITLNGKDAGFTTVGNSGPQISNLILDNRNNRISVFAGEREDPFFLDLRVLQEGLATGKDIPNDTFGNSNVSSIVVSAPIEYFQTAAKETNFSIWGTISR